MVTAECSRRLPRAADWPTWLAAGCEHLLYFQVDNPLADFCNPEFLGYHLLTGSEMTSQVVAKRDPLERVGNVVSVDGHLQIIEYSDLPDSVAALKNPDGSLRFWAGSIAVHLFDRRLLERLQATAGGLPFHVARKKVRAPRRRGPARRADRPQCDQIRAIHFRSVAERGRRDRGRDRSDTGVRPGEKRTRRAARHARGGASGDERPAHPLAPGGRRGRGNRDTGRNQPLVRCGSGRSCGQNPPWIDRDAAHLFLLV